MTAAAPPAASPAALDGAAHPSSWRQTWQQLQRSAQPHVAAFRRSVWALCAAAVLQGLALACLLPIFGALLPPGGQAGGGTSGASGALSGQAAHAAGWLAARPWLAVFALLSLAVLALRWRAQGFDYNGQMAEAIDRLRTRLGEQLRRMPLLRLQDKRTGELSAVLLGHVDENLNYTIMLIGTVANAILTPLAAALAVLWWDWRLGLAMLLVFPAVLPLHRRARARQHGAQRELASANARCQADLLEYAQGLPVLRASCIASARAAHLRQSLLAVEQAQVRSQQRSVKPGLVTASVTELGMLLVMAAGVAWATQGSLGVAVLAAVAVMLVRFGEPLGVFVNMAGIFEMIESALARIDALLAIAPLPQPAPAATPQRFDIAFESVRFAYAEGAQPVLEDFSARLPMHSMTALVGPSGGGKTTVTRLLMRHADPQAGCVRIGGVDLRHIPPEVLSQLVSVVFQDVYLFDDTVLANIRMARPEASDQDVQAAARAAQCLDFIERLPQGWHTRIGEMGARLSGGERQRISIARALLKNAPIVVLDEPTAALDTESECAVQRAIETLVQERTVIVIAHRLSTIAGAQQIIVLDQGRALQTGSHAALLAQGGRYAALWRAQQSAKQWRAKATPQAD